MITDRTKRINELAAKKKSVGLTAEEEAERQQLHKEFLAEFRKNVIQQLDNVYIVDDEGNEQKLKKKNGK